MKKICLIILLVFMAVYFSILKSLASSDIVILNTNNNKYHKVDCEYAKYTKNCKNIRKPLIRYSSAACCFPQKEKQQSLIQKYKVKKIFNKINEDKISLFFVDPVKAKKAQNKIINNVGLSLVALIDNAQSSIDIAAYGFDGQDDIINALRRAKKRGVIIRGVVDDYGATIYKRTNSVVKEFDFKTDINVPMAQRQFEKEFTRSKNALMHNKFVIVDSEYLWTGSTNLTNYCMTLNSNNSVVIISKDLARIYQNEFNQMYESNKFHTLKKIVDNKNDLVINDSNISVYFSPQDKVLTNAIIPIIKEAKEKIYVSMFYLTNYWITDALIEANNRGVEIRIIVDFTLQKEPKSQIDELKNAGISVKIENWRGKMHQKSMVVDEFVTVIASTNWTGASEYSNDENMLVIKNKAVANVQEKEFLRLWKSIK